MNLYNLHSDPKSLKHHDYHHETVPDLFWKKYKDDPDELKKRENGIATSPYHSLLYARDVIHKPFPLGEKAIASHDNIAYNYAHDVLHDRFRKGEKTIGANHQLSVEYAQHVVHGRFPAGEKAIAQYPHSSYYYARDVLHDRFPAGEKTIADRGYGPKYARDVIKGPWTYDGKTYQPEK